MGDRFDGKYLKDIDSMHFIMPFLFPNRCDNQAFFSFQIDLTNLKSLLIKRIALILITNIICINVLLQLS